MEFSTIAITAEHSVGCGKLPCHGARVPLQKLVWHRTRLNFGRSYAASAVNCCLRESGGAEARTHCCWLCCKLFVNEHDISF